VRHRALPPRLRETKGRACSSSSFSLIRVSVWPTRDGCYVFC